MPENDPASPSGPEAFHLPCVLVPEGAAHALDAIAGLGDPVRIPVRIVYRAAPGASPAPWTGNRPSRFEDAFGQAMGWSNSHNDPPKLMDPSGHSPSAVASSSNPAALTSTATGLTQTTAAATGPTGPKQPRPASSQLAAFFCGNVECGAPGVGVYDPLCTSCYIQWYNKQGTKIILENGQRFSPYDLKNFNYPIEDLPKP